MNHNNTQVLVETYAKSGDYQSLEWKFYSSNEVGQHAPQCAQDRVNIPIVKHQLRSYSFLWLWVHQVEVYNISLTPKAKEQQK
jgi:hypothetical protein